MSLTWFSIAVFGVWRVTHLLAAEDGPCDVVVRLRSAAGSGFGGKLLDCFYLQGHDENYWRPKFEAARLAVKRAEDNLKLLDLRANQFLLMRRGWSG